MSSCTSSSRSTENASPRSAAAWLARLAAGALLAGIEGYRLLFSPLLGGLCRFEPSCSRYASEAISRHGARRGAVLAARRLCRCHPWGGAGLDPVP